jgi:hypothetical protein
MKTYNRICIKDFTVEDFIINRGREYTTSEVSVNNTVTVFAGYWCTNVPVDIFAGEILFTE